MHGRLPQRDASAQKGYIEMSDFWKSAETIEPGKGYPLFSLPHLAWLAVTVICCVVGAIVYRKMSEKARKRFLITLAILIAVNTVVDQIILISTLQWTKEHLPLHMCSFGSFITVAHAFLKKDNRTLCALIYGMSMPGAILALVTPGYAVLPIWNYSSILSYTFHIMLVMYPICLIAGGYVPRFDDLKKGILPLLLVVAVMYGVNKLLDTDFLYINGGRDVGWIAAFANLFGPVRDLYVLVLFPLLIAALWTALFLPFHLIERHKAKKNGTPTPPQLNNPIDTVGESV